MSTTGANGTESIVGEIESLSLVVLCNRSKGLLFDIHPLFYGQTNDDSEVDSKISFIAIASNILPFSGLRVMAE